MKLTLHEALTTAASLLRLRRRDQERRFSAVGELDDPVLAGTLDTYQQTADLLQRVADNLTEDGHNVILDTNGFGIAV